MNKTRDKIKISLVAVFLAISFSLVLGCYDKEDVILGIPILHPRDGVVHELPEPNDAEVIRELEKVMGNMDDLQIKTFFQYISNDNY